MIEDYKNFILKEVEPFVINREPLEDTIEKRYLLIDGRIVCRMFDEKLCNNLKNCNGYMGYGCKDFSLDFYTGVSGYKKEEYCAGINGVSGQL